MSGKTTRRVMGAWVGMLVLVLSGCGGADIGEGAPQQEPDHRDAGPHGGRVLRSGDFELELAIFERGTPPELRAWASQGGRSVPAAEISLQVELARLGGRVDRFSFEPEGDFLRGEGVVAEPHSFEVSVEAAHAGERHTWRFESFEGRTRIDPEVAEALGVETAAAGPALLTETVNVYGRIRAHPEHVSRVRARFDGVVRQVYAHVGSRVQKGDRLLTVESDESLNSYSLFAPISGVVTQRDVNRGEHTAGRLLMTITDTSKVWADLSIFPGDRARVRVETPVSLAPAAGGSPISGVVSTLEIVADRNQAVVARVVLDNPEGRLLPGTFVEATVTVGEVRVPLAVNKTGLQAFRDFKVVYAQVGDEYEVRMLELGREDEEHVEVLGGLELGARYVVGNSHLIKADIEKSGASHDH